MATDTLNFTWTTGTPFSYSFIMRDPSGRRINLTGYSAVMQLRTALTDTAPLAVLSSDNRHLVLDRGAGEVTITVSTAEVIGIAWTTALYDLLLVDPNGSECRVYSGTITVTSGVTRTEVGVPLPIS